MQTIESYQNIRKAYLLMQGCNGGINRACSEEQACRVADEIIGADGVDHQDLLNIDTWLGTLTEEELLTFVDGEESEMEALASSGGEVGEKAHAMMNDLFDQGFGE